MTRRLIVLYDGTWNKKEDHTNVSRLKDAIRSSGENDPYQPLFYDTGVGTKWHNKITGGMFGRGLSENIRQGYSWLSKKFEPGDEIFVFGFSRGAYTARSLVGLIRKCGLLKEVSKEMIQEAYALYRNKKEHPNWFKSCDFRDRFSTTVRITFIGVWDTVGALGIPISRVPFSRDYYQWHDTELSKIVKYAYHAIAVNEFRKDYEPTVWTRIKEQNIDVDQRWFIGAHANVGGGYNNDPLPNVPLYWIYQKAQACGLEFDNPISVHHQDHLAKINDSYGTFMFGIYKIFKKKYCRPIGKGVNETIDASVLDRWKKMPGYRPKNLKDYL